MMMMIVITIMIYLINISTRSVPPSHVFKFLFSSVDNVMNYNDNDLLIDLINQ